MDTNGAYSLTPNAPYDATLIATGALVATARDVADKLARKGIHLQIVNCFSPSLFSKASKSRRDALADPHKPIFTAIDAHPSVLSEFANAHGASYGVTHTTPGGGDAPYFYKVNQLDAGTLTFNIENTYRVMQGMTPFTVQDMVIRECRKVLAYKAKCILFIDGPTRAGTSTFGHKLKHEFEARGIHVSGVLDSDYFLLSREARGVMKEFAYQAWLNNMNWFDWKQFTHVLETYTTQDTPIALDRAYIHGQIKKQDIGSVTTAVGIPNILIVEGPFIVNNYIRHFADYIVHLEASPSERWRRMMDANNLASRNRTQAEQAELNTTIYEPSRLLYESNVRGLFDMEVDNDDPEAKRLRYLRDAPDVESSFHTVPALQTLHTKTKQSRTRSRLTTDEISLG